MTNSIDLILIGAGNRGRDVYGRYIGQNPSQFRLVAVADPSAARREKIARQHNIPVDRQFSSWEDLLSRSPLAQAAIIATPDQLHTEPALAALSAGYDLLLEKPMARQQDNCVKLVKTAEQAGRLLQISHVLRYTPVMQKVKQILDSGELGNIITVSHRENVSFWHMAHSYVRGNWRNTAEASPMILAKCSHDFDLLYWLLERECRHLSSIGSLRHFHADQAPENGPIRCTDGCPIAQTCPYEATNIYLDLQPFLAELSQTQHPLYRNIGQFLSSSIGRQTLRTLGRIVPAADVLKHYQGWPRSVVAEKADAESVRQALESGPYGRCVYHCDNDVVDHQVVAMKFKDDISVTLTMHGHSHQEGRTLRIDGTHGTLFAKMNLFESEIKVHHKRSRRSRRTYIPHTFGQGHGGGDQGLMAAFHQALTNRKQPPLTTGRASLESHLLAFAAEQARLSGQTVQMDDYRAAAWSVAASTSANIPQPTHPKTEPYAIPTQQGQSL